MCVCVCGQDSYGSDLSAEFRMFDSSKYGGSDLLFKDSTLRLIGVGERRTYQEWLGQEYLETLVAMECPSSTAGMSSLSFHHLLSHSSSAFLYPPINSSLFFPLPLYPPITSSLSLPLPHSEI